MKAQKGDVVKVHYTGRFPQGDMFDTSEGNDPLEFDLGAGQVIEGFEEAIIGMEKGDKKNVLIPVDKAYGKIIEEYVIKAPRNQLPPDLEPQIGMPLMMPTPEGEPIQVTITDFDEASITLDANHPMAGKDLEFDLELVGILRN